jgi:hypothetical protein
MGPFSVAKTKSDTDDVAALKRELEETRARAMSAEGRLTQESTARRQAEQANMTAQERAIVSDQEACESNIESINGEIQSYEDQIAAMADEPGHGKEIAQLTRKIGSASAKLETASNRKDWLAGQRDRFKKQVETREKADEVPAGDQKLPNGALLSSFSGQTQQWLRDHPRSLTDGTYFDRVITAAQAATKLKGLKNDTTEFFAYVEDAIGEAPAAEETQEDEEPGEEIAAEEPRYEAERPQTRAAGPGSMAAPVARTAPHTGGGGGQRKTPALSAEQREVALALYSNKLDEKGKPISDADKLRLYAKNVDWAKSYRPQHFMGNA